MIAINAYIDTMHLESDATMEYLKQYKEYIKELISISDYDELCSDDTFWQLVIDADNYYSNECQSF